MGVRGAKPRRKEIVWSADFAYAIGLMVTDGCIYNDGLHLAFVSKDLEQVENIKRIFDIKANIKQVSSTYSKDKKYFKLQWGDVMLYRYLVNIGISPNKSRTISNVAIPDIYFFDFLRGHHDGDGCFNSYFDPRWKNSFMFYLTFISASKTHIDWLRTEISKRTHVNGHISHRKTSKIYQLRYAKADSLILLQHMFSIENTISLKRKRLKIEEALGIVGLTLPST